MSECIKVTTDTQKYKIMSFMSILVANKKYSLTKLPFIIILKPTFIILLIFESLILELKLKILIYLLKR